MGCNPSGIPQCPLGTRLFNGTYGLSPKFAINIIFCNENLKSIASFIQFNHNVQVNITIPHIPNPNSMPLFSILSINHQLYQNSMGNNTLHSSSYYSNESQNKIFYIKDSKCAQLFHIELLRSFKLMYRENKQ